jgi:hypothetical protein
MAETGGDGATGGIVPPSGRFSVICGRPQPSSAGVVVRNPVLLYSGVVVAEVRVQPIVIGSSLIMVVFGE